MTVPARTLQLLFIGILCVLFVPAIAHAQTITIDEARTQGDGATVTVEGTVTRAYGDFVRFQDGSGPTGASGLVVRRTSGNFHDDIADGTISQGTDLKVSGTLSEFNGLLQINEGDLDSYTVQGDGTLPSPQAVTLSTLQSDGEDYESELVSVTGLNFQFPEWQGGQWTFEGNRSYPVSDGTTELTFRMQDGGETELIGTPVPEGSFTYTGVVGEFQSAYQLIPTERGDLPLRFATAPRFVQVEEGDGAVDVSIRPVALDGDETVSVTAEIGEESTADGADVTGFDGSETFTFSGSDSSPKTLSVGAASDDMEEGVERLEITLSSTDGKIGKPGRFTLWILDNPKAQAPIAQGDSGDVLIEAVQQRYGDPRPMGYDIARDSMYARIYNDASNTVEGTYSGYQITVDPSQGDPSEIAANEGINTEHTWPQSQGAEEEPATSNLHILVPARAEVNTARSNYPFGEIVDSDATQWYYQDQSQSSPPDNDRPLWSEVLEDQTFEPRHSVKGDVARAVFYFVTVYPNRANFSFFEEQRETLLNWHEEDPVDATEMRRNVTQASYQGNAVNPFVMDSTLADRAYGSGADTGEDPDPSGTFELYADESELTPSSGQTDAQCPVHRSTGELVFFNSNDGGIFSWDGSSLSEERAASNLNSDIAGESSTIDRCDGVAVDANDNVYFLLRASGSSGTNSWPTYVYKIPASGTPSVLVSKDGLQGVAHDAGTVYLAGNEYRGAPEDGVYSVSETGEGQSLTTVAQDPALSFDNGMDVDGNGDLYAFSNQYADTGRERKIVRVTDPSGSASLEEFVDPYRSGSPLISNSGDDISDLRVVNYGGTEYVVVYNGSFQAEDGDQWATIQISDHSIELLFNRTNLLDNISKSGFTSAYTRSMVVNESGEVFAVSRFRDDDGGNVQSTDYIAKVSDAPPLPVEMAGFDAVQNGSSVELTWETVSERNNARFEVQRRATGEGWTQIGSVSGHGTTETAQNYRFTDAKPPFTADVLTYRLKQVDLDGSASYSKTVTVRRGVESVTLQAPFPNPAQGQATVPFAVPERQDVTLRLYDVLGRRVRTLVHGTYEGRQEARVDLSDLSSGVYFLRLQADGDRQTRRVTVVQ